MNEVGRRLDALASAGVVLLALTIVLTQIALSLPWWALFTNGEMSSWYLGTMCANGTCQGYQASPSLRDTFGLTGGLVTWGLILYVLALGVFVLSLVWPPIGAVTVVLGVLGSILLFAAPVYLYFALPGALASSGFAAPVARFFGSYTQPGSVGGTAYSWTGAAGWFLSWGVFLFSLAATAIAGVSARRRTGEDRVLEAPASLAREDGRVLRSRSAVEAGLAERFCPLCGVRYPGDKEFCSKDASPLKDVVP